MATVYLIQKYVKGAGTVGRGLQEAQESFTRIKVTPIFYCFQILNYQTLYGKITSVKYPSNLQFTHQNAVYACVHLL